MGGVDVFGAAKGSGKDSCCFFTACGRPYDEVFSLMAFYLDEMAFRIFHRFLLICSMLHEKGRPVNPSIPANFLPLKIMKIYYKLYAITVFLLYVTQTYN